LTEKVQRGNGIKVRRRTVAGELCVTALKKVHPRWIKRMDDARKRTRRKKEMMKTIFMWNQIII
jgi:hypothetical protein